MYRLNFSIILTVVIFGPRVVLSKTYMESGPMFEHGTVETSASEFEKGIDYSTIDLTDSAASSYRPVAVPQPDVPRTKYVTSPSGEKINLMKTYFDPVTKQPYRYVMRKKTQLHQEDDDFMKTASKFISNLLGSYESGTQPRPDYSSHKMRNRIPQSVSIKHSVNKREVPNSTQNETYWAPVFIMKRADLSHKYQDGKIKTNELNDKQTYNNIKDTSNHDSGNDITKRTEIDKNSVYEENGIQQSSSVTVGSSDKSDEKHESSVNTDSENEENSSGFMQSIKILQKVFMNCKQKIKHNKKDVSTFILSMQSCVQLSVMKALDRMLTSRVIPLNDYVFLVRKDESVEARNSTHSWNPLGKDLKGNSDFIGAVCERMFRMLQTHSVQFKLWDSPNEITEGRRRHHYRKAFPMMVAGYMMLSAFLVPLGFQFMAMIGGKALLLSKMALMMSMLGGFKKLLTPDQIYHSLPNYDYHGGWHHRSTNEQPAMTLAYTKANTGAYDSLQRDYTQQTQHWIDPKSYTDYSS